MALVSPGVQVSVIDESFYTPAEPGTVPMIFVVSGQDKTNGAGTGTATYIKTTGKYKKFEGKKCKYAISYLNDVTKGFYKQLCK